MAAMKAANKKAPKAKSKATSELPSEVNVRAIGTLLKSSYGKPAIGLANGDGPVFKVVRDRLPEEIKGQWEGEILELWVGLDDEENVFACAFVDFEITGVNPGKLAVALAEVTRDMGLCYGSFGSLDDKHVTFVVGLPGSAIQVVAGTMLADTIAYALNGAVAAKEHLGRVMAVGKGRKRG